MARVILTAAYENLTNWPGNLFEAETFSILARTATTFTYTLGAGSPFAGMKVTVTGTGFTWLGADATGGNISKIVISSGATTVLTMDSFAANTVASSLQVFHDDVFGWNTPDDDRDPNGTAAFSHLLSGNDVIIGTNGNDREELPGHQAGNDKFNLRGGDDQAWAGIGNDTIFGGAGYDRLSYERTTWGEGDAAYRGIAVRMGVAAGSGTVIDCWGDTDRFTSIESIRGSRFADLFIGGASDDEFAGHAGADTINGGGAADLARYDADYWSGGKLGVIVNLQTTVISGVIQGRIRDGFGNFDTVLNVEGAVGTRFADRFMGSTVRNNFSGGEGRDSYDGRGGADGDRVNFLRQFTDANQSGISVDLRRASNQIVNDGFGNTETAISIEQIVGSQQADLIIMNASRNTIIGHDGQDTLTGAGGEDKFEFWERNQIGDNDIITDFNASGPAGNIDRVAFDLDGFSGMSDTLSLVNGANATLARDQFIYNAANDVLYWDPDGTGAAEKIAICTLTGVAALTSSNIELY